MGHDAVASVQALICVQHVFVDMYPKPKTLNSNLKLPSPNRKTPHDSATLKLCPCWRQVYTLVLANPIREPKPYKGT